MTTPLATTLRNRSVDDLLRDPQRRQHSRHFHQLFRRLRLRSRSTRRTRRTGDRGHFDNLLGHRAIQHPQGVRHVVHRLRHRKIEDLHERADGAEIFHDVPHHLVLPASDLRQRCWQAPAGLFFEAEELRLGCGGLSDLRRSSARAPTPRPWPSSVSLRNGAKTRPRPWRRSSAHAATWSGAVAPSSVSLQRNQGRDQHKSHPLGFETSRSHKQGKGNACLSQTPGGGGGGSDGEVNVVSLSIAHHGMHRIMEVMSLWT